MELGLNQSTSWLNSGRLLSVKQLEQYGGNTSGVQTHEMLTSIDPFSQAAITSSFFVFFVLLLISVVSIFLPLSQVHLSVSPSVFPCPCLYLFCSVFLLYILSLPNVSFSALCLPFCLSLSLLPPGRASGIQCTHPSLHQASCQTERERLVSCCLELMSIEQTGPGEKPSLVSSKVKGEWHSEQWRVKRERERKRERWTELKTFTASGMSRATKVMKLGFI